MNNFFRTIIAGYGAKKLGGGCLSTILVFVVIYYALGTCNKTPVQTAPQNHSSIQARDHHPPDVSYLPGTTFSLTQKNV
jgi:hypothetical protein